jgi:hypothetical protein
MSRTSCGTVCGMCASDSSAFWCGTSGPCLLVDIAMRALSPSSTIPTRQSKGCAMFRRSSRCSRRECCRSGSRRIRGGAGVAAVSGFAMYLHVGCSHTSIARTTRPSERRLISSCVPRKPGWLSRGTAPCRCGSPSDLRGGSPRTPLSPPPTFGQVAAAKGPPRWSSTNANVICRSTGRQWLRRPTNGRADCFVWRRGSLIETYKRRLIFVGCECDERVVGRAAGDRA